MEWLTEDKVKEGSKTLKGALEMSITHHRQVLDATPTELKRAHNADRVDLYVGYCGLCQYCKLHQQQCPLNPECSLSFLICCEEWGTANDKFDVWLFAEKGKRKGKRIIAYQDFRQAETKLYKKLLGLRKKI